MNIKNESMNDWVGKIPGSKDKKKVESDFWRYFKKVIGQIPFAEDVVALYLLFTDPNYPNIKKGACLFALLYFICPLDLIPDFIPFFGFLDDAGVISAAIKIYVNDIEIYKKEARKLLKENGYI
ncbi:MAG: hypothetical protein CMD65_02345 [Gammaproteobacteria bacterium]|nr:hypothetical protein [Gammaproteobacteria bacterium]|tara:strand:+ start:379 stop:750 length:372 start_codon:yes stop_codon:yes gene_type:complete